MRDGYSASRTVSPVSTASCDKNAKTLFVGHVFFFLPGQPKTQNKTKLRHFKKIICFIAATVSVLLLLSGKWQWPKKKTRKKERKKTRPHALDSQWVSSEKAVIASLRPWRWWILPQPTAGSLNSKSFHPDGPLRSEPGCSLRCLFVSLFRLRCEIVVGPEHAGYVLPRPWRRPPRAGGFLIGSRRTIKTND